MPSGELLLMEVEDINPYLSLDLLSEEKRESFVKALSKALLALANTWAPQVLPSGLTFISKKNTIVFII